MTVDEEFAASRVPVASSLGRIAEQSCRKPVESASLCLEALTTDVDDESLTSAGRTAMIVFEDVRHGHGRRRRLLVGQRCQPDGRHAQAGSVVAEQRAGGGRRGERDVVVGQVAVSAVVTFVRLILAITHTQ